MLLWTKNMLVQLIAKQCQPWRFSWKKINQGQGISIGHKFFTIFQGKYLN